MPELRLNIATKEWVIIATERAKRPEEFTVQKKEQPPLPAHDEKCVFCPGNESKTPPETFRIAEGDSWAVRVIYNKFAALSHTAQRVKYFKGIFRSIEGVGVHEVIIDTPLHNTTTALLPFSQVRSILSAYRSRYLELSKDERYKMIIIFKNHGESAGTSLIHPHSQLVATPVVPSNVRDRLDEARRYYDIHTECVFCQMMAEELACNERIIFENKHFVAFSPFAALSPFHTWILPRRHMSSYGLITDDELTGLSEALQTLLAKLYRGLNNPDFNYVLRTAPTDQPQADYFHWYLSIVPRLTRTAGFELGSGMFINVAKPEESAQFLRNVKI